MMLSHGIGLGWYRFPAYNIISLFIWKCVSTQFPNDNGCRESSEFDTARVIEQQVFVNVCRTASEIFIAKHTHSCNSTVDVSKRLYEAPGKV